MDTMLWWVIGILVALLALGVLIPEIYSRRVRRREKRLGNRAKRRIQL